MDYQVVGLLGIFLLVTFILLGLHIPIALGVSGFLGLSIILGIQPTLSITASTLFEYGSNYTLSVLPLFIVMGLFAMEIGASKDAYKALSLIFGKIRGALGIATIGGCTIFGALTGSPIATAIVFAKVGAPEMVRHGYDRNISYGLVAASGALGMLIPPSILAIIYAAITEESIGALLLAGVGPGLTLAFCLAAGLVFLAIIRPDLIPSTRIESTFGEKVFALIKIWPFLLVIVVVIGGIYSGFFTVIEAAAVGNFVLLVLFVIKFRFTKRLFETTARIVAEATVLTSVVFAIFIFAQLFTRLMVFTGISKELTFFITELGLSPIFIVLSAALLYVVLGCFVDPISIVIVTVPLFMPTIRMNSIDPIWFGMVLVLASQVGQITPPVGINLFVVKSIAGEEMSIFDLVKGSFPFLVCTIVALGIVIAFPIISLWLPYTVR